MIDTLTENVIHQNVSLKSFNTFGVNVFAERYCKITSVEKLQDILRKEEPRLILGGGSNMLFTQNVDGLVLHIEIKHKTFEILNENEVLVKAGAGESWHQFVLWTINQSWGGLENLSLIPGIVGAAPIQNIGAYGVELKDTFVGLYAVNRNTGKLEYFDNEACNFGYRYSRFKDDLKNQYVITEVHFKLSTNKHEYKLDYGAIKDVLDTSNDQLSPKAISEAVISIRQSKLPDPAKIGNGGSFFKNPTLDQHAFMDLKERRPDVRFYALPDENYKIPAAWLIDQAGWKGYREQDFGVHKNQALVLVNYGGATGSQIWNLAQRIAADVEEKFGIKLEPEINII